MGGKKHMPLDELEQGIYVVNPGVQDPNVDLVFVPGFGADPVNCWRGEPSKPSISALASNDEQTRAFNWVTDPKGVQLTFGRARILRYSYASAWTGAYMMNQVMDNIALGLLSALDGKRQSDAEKSRAIIMIGHSMGGLVIAHALNEADARLRRSYGSLLTCVTACAFFGTPFLGTKMATHGEGFSNVLKAFGKDTDDALFKFMAYGNPTVTKLRSDFISLITRVSPSIQVVCFYEKLPIDYDKLRKRFNQGPLFAPAIDYIAGKVLGSGPQYLVTEESASLLVGEHFNVGLQTDHTDLVKFPTPTDERYKIVRGKLEQMIIAAEKNARQRMSASGQSTLPSHAVAILERTLDSGVFVRHAKRTVGVDEKGWITKDIEYDSWRRSPGNELRYLWILGPDGIGKTKAALTTIVSIENDARSHGLGNSEMAPLVAYFLCDTTPSGSSAIELLKSLIFQMLNSQPLLADYAKHFLKRSDYRAVSASGALPKDDESKATMSVQNLWTCLMDMLEDDSVGDVFLVINNIHLLEEDGDCNTLLRRMLDDADTPYNDLTRKLVRGRRRWLVTCEKVSENHEHRLSALLGTKAGRSIDTSKGQYAGQLQDAIKQHAAQRVADLASKKHYGKGQAFKVQSELVRHAGNNKNWIDVQYIRLAAMDLSSSPHDIEDELAAASCTTLQKLVTHTWTSVLHRENGGNQRSALKAVLRALVLASQDPTLEELSILSSMRDETELNNLIERCKPLLEKSGEGPGIERIVFVSDIIKHYLLLDSKRLLGLSGDPSNADRPQTETQQHHGELAWRCFEYLETVRLPEPMFVHEKDGKRLLEVEITFPQSLDAERSAICLYPLQHWLAHAMLSSPELADDLARRVSSFWHRDSNSRLVWLAWYKTHESSLVGTRRTALKGLDIRGMTAMHLAAAFGFQNLVSSLIRAGHRSELDAVNEDGYSPLHCATFNNHFKTAMLLIDVGTNVNLGSDATGTALHLAALHGHIELMEALINKKANINAWSKKYGPVINAAISSGEPKAVRYLLDQSSIVLDFAREQMPPLAHSASMLERALFQDILNIGKDKWTNHHYDQALIEASHGEKLDNIDLLLERHTFTKEILDEALLVAAFEDHWTCVTRFLKLPGLACNEVFYLAAKTMRGRQADDILQLVWDYTKHQIPQEVLNAALYRATDNEKEEVVTWLLDVCHADPNATEDFPEALDSIASKVQPDKTFGDALTAAAWDGTIRIVRKLLDRHADVENSRGCALQMAAQEGKADVVELLLEHHSAVDRIPGNDVDIMRFGIYRGPVFEAGTALQAACVAGRTAVVKVLLDHGADPNLGRGKFSNPLTAVIQNDKPDILKLLLESERLQVEVDGGFDDSTPVINCVTYMDLEPLRDIVETGHADINRPNDSGDTALIVAADRGEADSVEFLCEAGAEVMHDSPNRGFALQVALDAGHEECAMIITKHMVPILQAFNRAVANGNTLVGKIIKQPHIDHPFVSEAAHAQVIDDNNSLRAEIETIRGYQRDWLEMERKVKDAREKEAETVLEMKRLREEIAQERLELHRKAEAESAATEIKRMEYETRIRMSTELEAENKRLQQLHYDQATANAKAREDVKQAQLLSEQAAQARDEASAKEDELARAVAGAKQWKNLAESAAETNKSLQERLTELERKASKSMFSFGKDRKANEEIGTPSPPLLTGNDSFPDLGVTIKRHATTNSFEADSISEYAGRESIDSRVYENGEKKSKRPSLNMTKWTSSTSDVMQKAMGKKKDGDDIREDEESMKDVEFEESEQTEKKKKRWAGMTPDLMKGRSKKNNDDESPWANGEDPGEGIKKRPTMDKQSSKSPDILGGTFRRKPIGENGK
ncbi:MAG: hypothetical protein M1820_007968 [Bogoriella megaspora]|nr:MAG: hypothetical protein M1820_007968 [Bogoriella megaspora]